MLCIKQYFTYLLLLGGFFFLNTSFTPWRKSPAGTSSVPGLTNVFLDQTEVTNAAWREYLLATAKDLGEDSKEYKAALPDFAIWQQSYPDTFLLPNAFDDYPVVGISYDQAMNFCEWRSTTISAKENRDITFSLPSMKVYKLTITNDDPNKIAEGLYSTKLGFRNFLGLCENASEMTNKEGVAILGSDRSTCLDTISYFIPTPTLGFRCMAVLR